MPERKGRCMSIRRVVGVLFCINIAVAVGLAQEFTLDEIIKKNEAALGGAEAIAKIQTLKLTARMTTEMMGGQMDGTMVVQAKRPNLVRTEMNIMGNSAIAVSDGTSAWMINSLSGSSEPQKVDEKTSAGMLSSSVDSSIGALAGFKAAGHKVEWAGKEEIGGVTAYKIKVSFLSGMVTTYFLDAKTFLPFKWISRLSMMGQDMEVETYPSDFRKVGDILFAHALEQRLNGNTIGHVTYEKIELNTPMEDSLFKMPGKEIPPVKK